MKRRRHTPEQIVRNLREADRLLGEGLHTDLRGHPQRDPSRPAIAAATSSATGS